MWVEPRSVYAGNFNARPLFQIKQLGLRIPLVEADAIQTGHQIHLEMIGMLPGDPLAIYHRFERHNFASKARNVS